MNTEIISNLPANLAGTSGTPWQEQMLNIKCTKNVLIRY